MNYLFRRRGASYSPWQVRQGGVPPDSGAAAQVPAVPPAMPARQSTPLRACAAAFTLLLSPTPPDAGTAAIPARTPDIATAARRAAPTAYRVAAGTPPDAGDVAIPASRPGRADGPGRAAAHAYRVATGTPPDAGTAAQDTPIPAQAPAVAWGPRRATSSAYDAPIGRAPPDIYTDTFADATGTTAQQHVPDLLGTWVKHPTLAASDLVITNAGRVRSGGVMGVYYHTATPPNNSPDYDVSCDVVCSTNSTVDAEGPVGRVDPTAGNCYNARYRSSTGFQIAKFVGGSATILGSTYARVLSAGETARLTLSMSGTTIRALVDGIVRVTVTDSDITAAGFAGIFATSLPTITDSTGSHLDNFTGLPADPPFPSPGTFQPSRTFIAALFATRPGGAGLDVAAAQVPVFPDASPDLAAGPRRAAVESYRLLVSAAPRDAGDAGFAAGMPDVARGAARAPGSAYVVLVAAPRDLGISPIPGTAPDRAPGARRSASSSYLIVTGTPGDSGVAPVDPPVLAEYPDLAAGPRRGQTPAYPTSATPRDAGTAAIPGQAPGLARGPARGASSSYLIAIGTPPDAGTVALAAAMPATAPGTRRAGSTAYAVATGTPGDQGVLPTDTAIVPEYPDVARGPLRPAAPCFVLLASASPRDQGTTPVPAQAPDRAAGPRRAAHHTYTIATGTPRDAGTTPIPALWPARADRPRPAGNAAYKVLTGTPPDQGAVPGPVGPEYVDAAPGRRRAASSAYTILVLPPRDAGAGIVYRIYANAGSGPIDYATVVDTTALHTWTSGALAFPDSWKFAVRAYDAAIALGERNVDAAVKLTLDASGVDVTAMPDAPTGLSGHAAAAGAIVLDWTYALVDPTRAPAGFRVYRGTGGVVSYASPVAAVAYTRGTVHGTATIAGGTDGVAYTFGVRAYNATGEESNVATTTIAADATAPAAVLTLTGTATT